MHPELAPEYKECRIYEGNAAITRLAEMGLRVSYFETAVSDGHDRASRATAIHPKTYAGQVMWAETVASLRTQLLDIDAGWACGCTGLYETSYNSKRDMAIAVVGGDSNTGERAFSSPKTARRRGPVTKKRITRNILGQTALDLPEFKDPHDDELCDIWFYLLNARRGFMYSELSWPMSLGSDSRVGLWRERILVPPIPLTGSLVTPIDSADDDSDDDERPNVRVERR